MSVVEKVGRCSPLGATVVEGGVNFSVFSQSASGVELLLFDQAEDSRATRVIPIDPVANRSYHYWHVFVPGVGAITYSAQAIEGWDAERRGEISVRASAG
jgi:glycogen operon protein